MIDIEKLAREQASRIEDEWDMSGLTGGIYEDFAVEVAMAVAAVVLEEAAKICQRRNMGDNNREDMEARRCADAIRSEAAALKER